MCMSRELCNRHWVMIVSIAFDDYKRDADAANSVVQAYDDALGANPRGSRL